MRASGAGQPKGADNKRTTKSQWYGSTRPPASGELHSVANCIQTRLQMSSLGTGCAELIELMAYCQVAPQPKDELLDIDRLRRTAPQSVAHGHALASCCLHGHGRRGCGTKYGTNFAGFRLLRSGKNERVQIFLVFSNLVALTSRTSCYTTSCAGVTRGCNMRRFWIGEPRRATR
jgi:hypothetical protein